MAECETCGATDELVHTCNHCSGRFCPKHTLPENHNCPALRTDNLESGAYESDEDNSEVGPETGSRGSPRIVDEKPDFKTSPDVAIDGSVSRSSNTSKTDDPPQSTTGPSGFRRVKRAFTGGFVSQQYRGTCPHCGNYVSERGNTGAAGILECPNCDWRAGYPVLRHLTHRIHWRLWKRRTLKSVKFALVLISLFGLVAVFGTGIAPVDAAADGVINATGLSQDADRAGAAVAGFANRTEQSDASKAAEPDSSDGGGSINETRVEILIHEYINQERNEAGLPSLVYNDELNSIADNHSEDMATRSYFSHENPFGNGVSDRYAEAGYECRVSTSGNSYATGGENIAQTWVFKRIDTGQGTQYFTSERELARGVVNQWMNSSSHRQNLLQDYWESEGIGIAITQTGKVYATQNFC